MSKATEANRKILYAKVERILSKALHSSGVKGINYIPEGVSFDYLDYKVELTIKITKYPPPRKKVYKF